MNDATRRTLRTTLEVIVALAAVVPVVVATIGLDTITNPALAGILAGIVTVAATITRIAALPAVEEFLQTWLPWLAAESSGRHEL